MDSAASSLAAQSEIQFLLSLLRISYPGDAAARATDAIEQLLTPKAVN